MRLFDYVGKGIMGQCDYGIITFRSQGNHGGTLGRFLGQASEPCVCGLVCVAPTQQRRRDA